MKGKIGIASLGCPKNQVDAEIMLVVLKVPDTITNDESEALAGYNSQHMRLYRGGKKESIETIIELADLKKR